MPVEDRALCQQETAWPVGEACPAHTRQPAPGQLGVGPDEAELGSQAQISGSSSARRSRLIEEQPGARGTAQRTRLPHSRVSFSGWQHRGEGGGGCGSAGAGPSVSVEPRGGSSGFMFEGRELRRVQGWEKDRFHFLQLLSSD